MTTLMSNIVVQPQKINGLRFGQLLVNALEHSGNLQVFQVPQDINSDRDNRVKEYLVTGTDLFYIENDELEAIIQQYLQDRAG